MGLAEMKEFVHDNIENIMLYNYSNAYIFGVIKTAGCVLKAYSLFGPWKEIDVSPVIWNLVKIILRASSSLPTSSGLTD